MNKGFYWIVAVVVIFIAFLSAAAFYKNRNITGLPIPGPEIVSTDWTVGTSTEVILMEYSDFQCPACRAYFPIVEQLIAEYGGHFTFVYRHFPLAQHGNARATARASEAAGRQGKFFEMYRILFQNQDTWANNQKPFDIFRGYAGDLALDLARFETDYNSPDIKGKIDNDYKSGLNLGVNSTPSFFINGNKINIPTGNTNEEILAGFKSLLDKELRGEVVTLPLQ